MAKKVDFDIHIIYKGNCHFVSSSTCCWYLPFQVALRTGRRGIRARGGLDSEAPVSLPLSGEWSRSPSGRVRVRVFRSSHGLRVHPRHGRPALRRERAGELDQLKLPVVISRVCTCATLAVRRTHLRRQWVEPAIYIGARLPVAPNHRHNEDSDNAVARAPWI